MLNREPMNFEKISMTSLIVTKFGGSATRCRWCCYSRNYSKNVIDLKKDSKIIAVFSAPSNHT